MEEEKKILEEALTEEQLTEINGGFSGFDSDKERKQFDEWCSTRVAEHVKDYWGYDFEQMQSYFHTRVWLTQSAAERA